MSTLTVHCRLPPPGRVRRPLRAATAASPTLAVPSRANQATLRSTWPHRAWTAAGSAAILHSLSTSLSLAADSGSFAGPLAAAFVAYSLADLATGFYHWFIDNYGDASTPFFGAQIEAFQGHHKYPTTITLREPCNNLYALARAVALVLPPVDAAAAGNSAAAHAFVGVFAACVVLSQQFHAWAHDRPRRLPPGVAGLQEAGVLVSRPRHAAHHRPPYNTNYCIVSGMCNYVLDQYRVFEVLETVVYLRTGVRPRSWDEPDAAWREDTGAGDDSMLYTMRATSD